MLRYVLCGLCRNPGGILFLAGAIGVLTGVQHLLAAHPRPHGGRATPKADTAAAVPCPHFRITRTRSEFGYTYWVLRGIADQSYALFDTWEEAMAAAQSRIATARVATAATASEAVYA